MMNRRHFRAKSPILTHWRKATCSEIDCPHYLLGWVTTLETNPSDKRGQLMLWDARNSGRQYRAVKEGPLTRFYYGPGQTCFRISQHRKKLERDPIFSEKTGPVATGPMEPHRWLDNFGNHLERLKNG